MINIEDIIERDMDRCGSYVTLNYEFPFPEESVLKERENEEMRYQLAKFTVALRKRILAKLNQDH